MRPFSAFYFVTKNKWRAASLIFMFVLTFAIYITGLYISNVERMFDYSIHKLDRAALLRPLPTDEKYESFYDAIAELETNEKVTLLQQGVISSIYTTSIMNFNNGFLQYSFRSAEDFLTYCDFAGIAFAEKSDERELGNGSVIMSTLQAKNRGLAVGDTLVPVNSEEYLDQEYVLDAVTDEAGYHIYYISDSQNAAYMLLATGMDQEEFRGLVEELNAGGRLSAWSYDYFNDMITKQIAGFHSIYYLLILLLAVVMAITVNAAFAGLYQHRQSEFALYKAIGISRWRLRFKIVGEIVLLDLTGIVIGAAIVMLGIYLFNHLYLMEHGFLLFYYNRMALYGMVVSNVIILVPVTLSQGHWLLKADICDY